MKKILTLLGVLLVFSGISSAQHIQNTNEPHGKKAIAHYNKVKGLMHAGSHNEKTTAVQQRLTSYSSYDDAGTGLSLVDSIDYYYDFGKGSLFDYTEMRYNDYYYYPGFGARFVSFDSAFIVNSGSSNDYSIIQYTIDKQPLQQVFYNDPVLLRNTWAYDTYGLVTTSGMDTWSQVSQSWDNDYRTFYIYDVQGNLVADSSEMNNSASYDPVEKNEYTYFQPGQPATITTYQYNAGAWVPDYKTTIAYNANGLPVEILFEEHNGTGWIKDEKINIGYMNDMYQVSETDSLWNVPGNNWYLQSEEYRHLNNVKVPDSIFYRSMVLVNQWDTTISKITYDNFNDPVSILYFASANTPHAAEYFYYQQYDPAVIDELEEEKTILYPNPATARINLSPASLAAGTYNYSIVNIAGQYIHGGELTIGNTPVSIDINSLQPGSYLLHLEGNIKATMRFIKQ